MIGLKRKGLMLLLFFLWFPAALGALFLRLYDLIDDAYYKVS